LVPQKFSEALSGGGRHWPLAQQPVGHVVGLHATVVATQEKVALSQRWFDAPQSWQAAPPVPQKLFDVLSGGGKHWPLAQQPSQLDASQPIVPVPPPPPEPVPMHSAWPVPLLHPLGQLDSTCHEPPAHCRTAGGTDWQARWPSAHGGHRLPAVATLTSQDADSVLSTQPRRPSQGTDAQVPPTQASTVRDDSQATWSAGEHEFPALGGPEQAASPKQPRRKGRVTRMGTSEAAV
jgi:hypothetical protein